MDWLKTNCFKSINKDKKKWTILVYANGSNELEPEVYKRFLELQHEPIDDNFNVIIQLGRAPRHLVKSLRPTNGLDCHQEWSGVRRYEIRHKKAIEVEDLGNINMADPNNFCDFIVWGMKHYPSQRNMVIISGHGAGFVGIMTDYTQYQPSIMNMDGLVKSLYKIKNKSGKNIDCLLLDSCYMNMIEVWHEIAIIPNKPVKYLLAPAKNVNIEGLPYHLIIRCLQQNNFSYFKKFSNSLSNVMRSFNSIYVQNNYLLVVKLKKDSFLQLKKEVNHIGEMISESNINLKKELNEWCYRVTKDPLISILDLENLLSTKFTNVYFKNENLRKILCNIIIYPHITKIPSKLNEGPSLYLPILPKQYIELRGHYDSLLFAQNNRWLTVIGGKGNIPTAFSYNEEKHYDVLPPPIKIPLNYVVASILDQNPGLTIEEAWDILRKIGWYQKN